MAKRPTRQKQIKRLEKALRRRSLQPWVDLVWWLKSNHYADTTGQALRILLDGKVRLESHVVGRERVSRIVQGQTVEQWEPVTRVPGHLREVSPRLHVST